MNLGDFSMPARYDRWGASALPSGVVRLTNLSPNFRGEGDYITPGGRMGHELWNPGTGGYVDRLSGVPLATMGQDRASLLRRLAVQFRGAGADDGRADGGGAFYGDSYGQVQGAAAQARQRRQSYDLAQQEAAARAAELNRAAIQRDAEMQQQAAQFQARLNDAAADRSFRGAQSAADRDAGLQVARLKYGGGGGEGGGGSFGADSSAAPAVNPEETGPAVTGNPYLNPNQTPYYRRGVGYVRDFIVPTTAGNRAVANDRIDELMAGVGDEADAAPLGSTSRGQAPAKLTAEERNLLDEPVNVARFDAELTPALTRRNALQTAQENNTQAKAAIATKLAEYTKAGSIKWDKDLETYVPTSPTALGAGLLPQLLKDSDSVEKTLADIKEKLAEAHAQVNDVTTAHGKSGLRYKEPLVPIREGENTGPGFIIGRRGATPLNVPAPVRSVRIDPFVKSYRDYANSRRTAKPVLQEEARQLRQQIEEDQAVRARLPFF